MLFEQFGYRSCVANIQIVVFVTSNIRDQIVARFFGGSFGAEKFCAHIIIDADNPRAPVSETLDRFGTD